MDLDPLLNGRFAIIQGDSRSGGMADILRAVDTQASGRPVAIKLFRFREADDEYEREAFEIELRALRDLRHPGIVELIDSGTDSKGRRYLVLEWIERTLIDHVRSMPQGSGWDDLASTILIPLLRALDFAHGRGCIHRDLKPANVLITEEGEPKLADFGIAKLKRYLDQSVTMRDFCTPPFCPPEPDDGTHQYARDVYAFAALSAYCMETLDGRTVRTHEEMRHAIDNLDTTPEIQALLKRAINPSPEERPTQAGVLLAELLRLQRQREDNFERQYVLHLRLTSRSKDTVRSLFETADDVEAQRSLLQDLGDRPCIERYRPNGPNSDPEPGHYRLLGNTLSLHIGPIASDNPAHLDVLGIRQNDPSYLDRARDRSMPLLFQVKITKPANETHARQTLQELDRRLAEFEHEQSERDKETAEEALFGRWRRTLDAQEQLSKRRFPPIRYSKFERHESALVFDTDSMVVDDIVGTRWKIRTPSPPSPNGEVLHASEGRLVLGDLRFEHEHDSLPSHGQLLLDDFAQHQAVSRQRDTVDVVRDKRAGLVNVRLTEVLLDPSSVLPTPSVIPDGYFQDLDEAKSRALESALGEPEVLVVHGPPGTGKTRLIAEIVLQAVRSGSAKSILLTSQTHVALDNAIERIRAVDPDLSIVRVGSLRSEKVAPASQPLLLDNQVVRWSDEVLERGEAFLAQWAEKEGLDHEKVQQAIWLRMYVAERTSIELHDRKIAEIRGRQMGAEADDAADDADGVPGATTRQLMDAEIEEFGARKREAERRLRRVRNRLTEASDEWSKLRDKATGDLLERADMLIPESESARLLGDLIRLHPEWADRLGSKRGLEAAILAHFQVVAATCVGLAGVPGYREVDFDLCILDEASKATATEALVPLARSRRWILVGDQKQLPPYQEDLLRDGDLLAQFQLTQEDVRETAFDRLIAHLPEDCQRTLSVQHRMVKPIGELVSKCFYGGRVESQGPDAESWVQDALGASVAWWSTSSAKGRFEAEHGLGYANPLEAEIVARLLDRMQAELPASSEDPDKQTTVVVLTGYVAQRRELERRIDSMRPQLSKLDVDVNTIDAYQGQEADIAIFSMVRSNATHKVGFLKEFSRLNVALSRGRLGLAIIGDHAFFRSLSDGTPGRTVADYVVQAAGECRVVDWIKAR
jgi:serine/threonine protein kinase